MADNGDSMDIDIDLGEEPDMAQYETQELVQVRADATVAQTNLMHGEGRTTHGD